jgi:hypothetical protein
LDSFPRASTRRQEHITNSRGTCQAPCSNFRPISALPVSVVPPALLSIAKPTTPATNEAERIARLAVSSSRLLPNASVATKRDFVNPIPPGQGNPSARRHPIPCGREAIPGRADSQIAPNRPTGFPTGNPAMMPTATGSASAPRASRLSATPAVATANTGMLTKAAQPCSLCSIF